MRAAPGDLRIEWLDDAGSALAVSNPLMVRIMANALGRRIEVPEIAQASAVGAAIHGAVASGVAADYREASARYGARQVKTCEPDPAAAQA